MLEFDEAKHQYRLNDEKIPSVTQVLSVLSKPGLEWWSYGLAVNGVLEVMRQCTVDPENPQTAELLKKMLTKLRLSPSAVLSDSAKRGTNVHSVFSNFAGTGCLEEVADELLGYVTSLRHFIDFFKPRIVGVEQRVYSPSLKVAGTYDALLEIDGQLVLIDWKTSKRIYDSHHLQSAAYEGMRLELGETPACPMIVRLDGQGGEPEYVRVRATYDDFKAAYVLWQARKRIGRKEKVSTNEEDPAETVATIPAGTRG